MSKTTKGIPNRFTCMQQPLTDHDFRNTGTEIIHIYQRKTWALLTTSAYTNKYAFNGATIEIAVWN